MISTAPLKEKVVTKPHPGGLKGAMMSLDEVATKMWSARNSFRVRQWVAKQLAAAGNPTGVRDRVQVILDAYRKKVPYLPDPVQSEQMAGPEQTLCLDPEGICLLSGDCDDASITVGACCLNIGIPVQVVGASYKEPLDVPTHVYIQCQDDSGQWFPVDATTTYSVGNVHDPARTWIIDPNKGVGAAGLPGGDFVGVGRVNIYEMPVHSTLGPRGRKVDDWGIADADLPHDGIGLGQTPSYAVLLQQLVSSDLPSLQAAWTSVQQTITSDASNDPCSGLGGQAWLVPQLQQISDDACTLAHNAANAALGYTLNGSGCGAASYEAAQNATDQACTLQYSWPGPEWGPYGTATLSGSSQATCLDVGFYNAVGAQVSAAIYAVRQAQVTANACIVAAVSSSGRTTGSGASLPGLSPGPRVRRGSIVTGEFGVGGASPAHRRRIHMTIVEGEWGDISRRGEPVGVGALIITAGDIEQEQQRTLATAIGVDVAVKACTTLDATTLTEWNDFYTGLKTFCTQPVCNFWYPGMPTNCIMATASSGDTMMSWEKELQAWQARLTVCPNTPPTLATYVASSPIPTGQTLTDILMYGAVIVGVVGGVYVISSVLPRK